MRSVTSVQRHFFFLFFISLDHLSMHAPILARTWVDVVASVPCAARTLFIDFDDTIATSRWYEGSARWFEDEMALIRAGRSEHFSDAIALIARSQTHNNRSEDLIPIERDLGDRLRALRADRDLRCTIVTARSSASHACLSAFLRAHALLDCVDAIVYCAPSSLAPAEPKSVHIAAHLATLPIDRANAPFAFVDDSARNLDDVYAAFSSRVTTIHLCHARFWSRAITRLVYVLLRKCGLEGVV